MQLRQEQKVLLLALEFSELSQAEVENALEAQAGNLQAAAAILSLHASTVRCLASSPLFCKHAVKYSAECPHPSPALSWWV